MSGGRSPLLADLTQEASCRSEQGGFKIFCFPLSNEKLIYRDQLMRQFIHVYEVRPRKDRRGVDLISDVLPFACLWYGELNATSNAVDYTKFYRRTTLSSVTLEASRLWIV